MSSWDWYCWGFDHQEAQLAGLVIDLLFLALSRHRVVPLYTWVDAWWPTESRPAHNRVRLGDFLYRPFFTSLSLHTAVHNIRP